MSSGVGGGIGRLTAVGIVSGFAGGLLVALSAWLAFHFGWIEVRPKLAVTASSTPSMDYIDNFSCPKGQNRIVLMRGEEDGFARSGDEPATIRPALMRNGRYANLAGNKSSLQRSRQYDEPGVDKHLIDFFDVPRGILSGELILTVRAAGDNSNDVLTLGDFDETSRQNMHRAAIVFYAPLSAKAGEPDVPGKIEDGLKTFDLKDFTANPQNPFDSSLIQFLNAADRPNEVDFSLAEDTAADFAALLLCQEPEQAMGTTFWEYRIKPLGEDLSYFSCDQDTLQDICDPYRGDRLCSVPTKIACYKDGERRLPKNIRKDIFGSRFFVGGEIRLSEPVRGDAFATLGDANGYCAQQFGKGWRVLSYHEAGGQVVFSYSNIAPKKSAIVHVGDQEYANCWDRPESLHGQ